MSNDKRKPQHANTPVKICIRLLVQHQTEVGLPPIHKIYRPPIISCRFYCRKIEVNAHNIFEAIVSRKM